jgi:hypothetical protein
VTPGRVHPLENNLPLTGEDISMSEEEMNKKMEFIVEQQANFAAQIEMMREVQAADAKLLKEETTLLKEETKQLKERERTLADAVLTVVGLIRNLTEAQQRTDQRLNIFINVVERYISGNGGGATNPA